MPSGIPGDPGAIRAGADRLRIAGEDAADAARQVDAVAQATRSGWTGAAHDAFAGAAARTGARVGSMARLADAAAPLLAYADELEGLQRAVAEASAQFDAAWAAVTGPGAGLPSAQLDAARSGLEAPAEVIDDLRRRARAANERAAAAVADVARVATDEFENAQQTLADGAIPRSVAINGADGIGRLLTTAPAGVVGYDLVSDTMRRGAGLGADTINGARGAGSVAAPVLTGLGQGLEDASNPYYSTGERAGRITAQATTVGGAALAGGALGAAVGSVVPGVGTVAGAVLGAAGATIVGYATAEYVDERNDRLVDAGGDLGDAVQDETEDLGPW
ncbi:hypothetical protein GCM10023200_01740 [Actinomycetospora chlora]|uniref:WXG100 family type VII secretion target n=1 Tax=Actinomycetospora chlora TaxID=663608 RepID=A0ABP9A627_9PSEU